MKKLLPALLLISGASLFGPEVVEAQEPSEFLAVGQMAPDMEVVGATRHGVLSEAVSLEDLRGETVVLAFFFKARTGG